ncbi:MAG: TerB N-terminal domain-containing protein, partial [Clostridia bacterium]|nr:TerB N-terminal domain-containing protein [Clostridia bacterium]
MPKCDKCGKRGLFLKLSNGLCNECLSLEQSVANNKRMNIAVSVPPETGLANPSAIIEKHTAVVEQTAIEPNGFDDSTFRLHPDLEGLIWFVDGKWKNCVDESINYDSTFIVRNNMRVEPSAIQTTLPISLPAEGDFVESLGYYPSYSGMSAVQRGKYLLFLCDPYQPIDIGYVFVLYYGLERFLITNDYQHAFEEILKLRDVHRNNSFQSYSSSALIYTAITKNRKDLL